MIPCLDENQISALFERRLAPEAASAVEGHLDACASCRQLVSEVTRAQQSLAGAGAFSLPAPAAVSPLAEEALPRGTLVDRYVVVDRVGQGGMGVVYSAFDPELDRKVALKLLRLPEGGQDALLREAQAMARISHRNVIDVYDVGRFNERVFLAMEFLEGEPLGAWLARPGRTWRQGLEALLQAGRGLAAAHAAGLVHRDFKPDNVLVGRDGRVCVTDFGLARAPDAAAARAVSAPEEVARRPLLELATFHRSGAWIGTPAYMAPEQLDGRPADARSDQFAFCVTLHEALFGARPFPGDSVELLRSWMRAGPRFDVQQRGAVPAFLRRALARGLALAPEQRFSGMAELLAALEADPARRRRTALVGAGAVALLSLTALVSWQVQARKSGVCRGAAARLAGAWDAPARAALRKGFLATGAPFAQDALKGVESALDGYAARWAALHEASCAATRVSGEQSEAVLTQKMFCLERRRRELGALASALAAADAKGVERSQEAAARLSPVEGCADGEALLAGVREPDDPALRQQAGEVRAEVAKVRALELAGQYGQGVQLGERTVERARKLGHRPVEAEALLALGRNQVALRDARAARTLEEALWAAEASRHDEVAAAAWTELFSWNGVDDQKEALATSQAERASAALERLGAPGEPRARFEYAQGHLAYAHGRYAQALPHYQRALALFEAAHGAKDVDVASAIGGVGAVYVAQGQQVEALGWLTRAARMQEEVRGESHPKVAGALHNLGVCLRSMGRLEEAQVQLTRALKIWERALGPAHPNVAQAHLSLGTVFTSLGKAKEALEEFQTAQRLREAALGAEHPDTVQALVFAGGAMQRLDRLDESQALLTRALALREKLYGPEHLEVGDVLTRLGTLYLLREAPAKALPMLTRAAEIFEKVNGPEHPLVAAALSEVGVAQANLHQWPSAVRTMERALQIIEKGQYDPALLAHNRFALAQVLWESALDRPRARRLALQAKDALSTPPVREADLAEVEAWLKGKGAS